MTKPTEDTTQMDDPEICFGSRGSRVRITPPRPALDKESLEKLGITYDEADLYKEQKVPQSAESGAKTPEKVPKCSRKPRQRDHIQDAAEAFSDLDALEHIIVICERLHTSSFVGASRIIKMCKAEQSKRLRDYDRAALKAGGGTYENPR